jgi:tryptophan synthase alpha chain
MGYSADLVESGIYLELAKEGLVDAFVIPDNDDEAFDKMVNELTPLNVDMIRFLRPNCSEGEMRNCFQNSSFVYYQLFEGETGSAMAADDFTEVLSIAGVYDHLRVLAGFGINTHKQAESLLSAGFDGFIVGTAMVRELNKSVQSLLDFVAQFNYGVRRASG